MQLLEDAHAAPYGSIQFESVIQSHFPTQVPSMLQKLGLLAHPTLTNYQPSLYEKSLVFKGNWNYYFRQFDLFTLSNQFYLCLEEEGVLLRRDRDRDLECLRFSSFLSSVKMEKC